jgi:non-ribosomal peptide synthetase component F
VPLIASSRANLESSAASSAEQLRSFFNDWWQQFGMTPLAGILKLVIAETANFPEVTRFFHDEVIEPSNQVFASILRRGIERGEFRPIDVEATVSVFTAPLVLKAIWIHSVQRCVPLDPFFPVERFLAAHCDAALCYLKSDSAGTRSEGVRLADSRKPDQPSCSSWVR